MTYNIIIIIIIIYYTYSVYKVDYRGAEEIARFFLM